MSLREAVAQALARHPVLAAGAERLAASESLRIQAGLRPNPRLFLQTENLRGYGAPSRRAALDRDLWRRQVAGRVQLAYWTAASSEKLQRQCGPTSLRQPAIAHYSSLRPKTSLSRPVWRPGRPERPPQAEGLPHQMALASRLNHL